MGTQKDDVRGGRGPAAGRATASAASITVREAEARDAAAVAALLTELDYPSSAGQAAERIERIAADPSTWLVVAQVEDEVAGLAALHVQTLVERDDPGCELAAMVVGERFRRRGVGILLMQAIEEEALSRGCVNLVLNTAHRRADAHAFYEALGYEHTGRRYAKELS